MSEELRRLAPKGIHSVPVRHVPTHSHQPLLQVVDGHDAAAGRVTERALWTRS
ncbi:hypothetical protein DPMN_018838 [Dreissena polymorpha]|uniref:Uncharacterized protein n=1 Tax=Dreissena polymorpha TaxID=45954 RepID=A0A9D4NH87_DREPO|nr:hypothetical protein DPMN_018838 [Dreissena polymorpha]